jgi:hypothetical protein
MSGVFRNIDPPTPHRPASVYPPPPPLVRGGEGEHTRQVERGWGVNSSEDARHGSVLYICKYFVVLPMLSGLKLPYRLAAFMGGRPMDKSVKG